MPEFWVKSGKFGHQVNSDTHLQTVEIQMRQLLMSRLIRSFTVCLVNLIFVPITELWNKQGGCPNLAVCPKIPDFTLPTALAVLTFNSCLYSADIIFEFQAGNVMLLVFWCQPRMQEVEHYVFSWSGVDVKIT